MDIVYILAPVLFIALVYLLIVSMRNLARSKKNLNQIRGVDDDPGKQKHKT